MPRIASVEKMQRFRNRCLSKLDQQVFALEAEEAKKSAIQAVQRVLRDILDDEGDEAVLEIVRAPRRIILPIEKAPDLNNFEP